MRFFTPLLFILSFFSFNNAKASHIVGGELIYTYLGNNQYHITLKLYRDCTGNTYPDPLHLAIYHADDPTQLIQIDIPFPGAITLPNDANNPCLIVPPNICVEQAIYDTIVTLPPIPGGYNIVYQVCCRNYTLTNIPSNDVNFGASYHSFIPDPSLGINNEAFFNEFPPTVICADYPFVFDHSATDLDGDSLVYGLCVLYDNDGTSQPNPPNPPPFPIITNYNAPYDYLNPMGGNPALSIDPATGLLTITPNTLGQFVVGICVTEYRDGVFLCEHRRDFQFNVTTCSPTVVAAIIPNLPEDEPITINCNNLTFTFPNASTVNAVYYWDFGVTSDTTNSDTSNLFNPTFTFPDTGTFLITLIVHPTNSTCADTTQGFVSFYPILSANIDAPDGCTGNVIQFSDLSTSTYGEIDDWYWTLGSNITSSAQNPTYTYNDTGTYDIQLIVETDFGCSDTINSAIQIHTGSINSVFGDTIICKDDVVQIGVDAVGTVTWSPNYEISNVNSFTPMVTADSTTLYQVVAISPDGCIEYDSVLVIVFDTLIAVAGVDTILCPGESVTLTGGGGLTYAWSPSTYLSSTNTPTTVSSPPDNTTTSYIFTTTVGSCVSTASVTVIVLPYPSISLGDETICPGDSVQLFPSGVNSNFSWSPAEGLSATDIANPWASPDVETTYYVSAVDTNACPVVLYDTAVVSIYNDSHIISPTTTIILGTSTLLHATNGVNYQWSPSEGLSDVNVASPVASPTVTTTYFVLITYPDGCKALDSVIVNIDVNPVVIFPNAFSPNGDGLNDFFKPYYKGLVTVETFKIYNRWGQMIFESNNLDGWDGTFNGTEQGIGTYAYFLVGKGKYGTKQLNFQGNFTLVR